MDAQTVKDICMLHGIHFTKSIFGDVTTKTVTLDAIHKVAEDCIKRQAEDIMKKMDKNYSEQ